MSATTAVTLTRPGAAPLSAIDDLRIRIEGAEHIEGAQRVELVAGVPILLDEPNLRGHFPGFPVFPGIFVIEALSQAVDMALRRPDQGRLVLRRIVSVRFLAPLLPPDRLTLDLVAVPDGPAGWSVSGRGRRGDDTVTVELRTRYGGADA